jgi:DNA-binding transcriptional LysR family regulator
MAKIDIDDLIAFTALADLGSFSAAAEHIHISQPAFSRRIDKLEKALESQLVERTTRQVMLTATGRDFHRNIQRILSDLDVTIMGVKGTAVVSQGEVIVGCVPSAVNYFASVVIKKFHRLYPMVKVKLIDSSANDILLDVARGDADFGINFVGSQDKEIEFTELVTEHFVAACRRDHPLAREKHVRWSDLEKYDYIAADKGSGNRLIIDQALASLDSKPHSIFETQHGTTMIGLVEAGLGVASVPSMAMPADDHPLLISVPLIDPEVKRVVGLIKRRGRELNPLAQQLMNMFLDHRTIR